MMFHVLYLMLGFVPIIADGENTTNKTLIHLCNHDY